MQAYDLVVMGGGPAGLAAAVAAKNSGVNNILIIEREISLGGTLNQCVYTGFRSNIYEEEVTGPEFAQLFIDKVEKMGISYKLNTMVIELNKEKELIAINGDEGIIEIKAKAIVMAMGCRERPRGSINILGSECAGIFTAGTVQKFVNIEGVMPGKEIVILGSGDIGLIMARRMTLEGAEVKAVVELMPYCGGLKKNVNECIADFNIPLKLNHTVIDIKGKERLEGVTIAQVDENKKSIQGTEELIACDTLILSVGLFPQNELIREANIEVSPYTGGPLVNESMETGVEGIFACGNVLHIHDYVESIVRESELAGKKAAAYLGGQVFEKDGIEIKAEEGVKYTVPTQINIDNLEEYVELKFKVNKLYNDSYIDIYLDDIRIMNIYKRVMHTSEMQIIKLPKELLSKYPDCKVITIKIEGE